MQLTESLQVTVLGKLNINVTYDPLAMTPKLEGKLAAIGRGDTDTDIQTLMELYSKTILDWDFEMDGQVIKPTCENLFEQVPSVITDSVMNAIREHMRPNQPSETP